MRRIIARVSVGICDRTTEFEVEDNLTDDEIMDEAVQWAQETIDVSWEDVTSG